MTIPSLPTTTPPLVRRMCAAATRAAARAADALLLHFDVVIALAATLALGAATSWLVPLLIWLLLLLAVPSIRRAHRVEAIAAMLTLGLMFVAGETWPPLVVWPLLLAIPRTRRWLRRQLRTQRLVLKWEGACRAAGLVVGPDREFRSSERRRSDARRETFTPRARWGFTRSPLGTVLDVYLPRGLDVPALAAKSEKLAAAFHIRDVRVVRDPIDAGRAFVTLVDRDPLADRGAIAWVHARAPFGARVILTPDGIIEPVAPPDGYGYAAAPWGIPIGLDEAGNEAWLKLPERNVLIGGLPGAGKSNLLALIAASAALDARADVHLHLIDAKRVELAFWSDVAEGFARTGPEAIALLEGLVAAMDERYTLLESRRLRKVTPELGLPYHLVLVDELASFTQSPVKKERDEFVGLLTDLVRRGRAAGVIVVAATQKPSADVVPTFLRDLFSERVALRCTTAAGSDTILGDGMASLGHNAARLPAAPGMALLGGESGGDAQRVRISYLPDEMIEEIAARAARGRRGEPPAEDEPHAVAVHGAVPA